MSSADAETKPSLTIVTCIESGILETEVPLMVATLRRFGGRFADCQVIAASPRAVGLPLLRKTRRTLDDLGVKLVERNLRHRYRWWNFINKPTSLVLAAPHVETKDVLWLDGDTLIASPPEAFGQYPDTAVQAIVEEQGPASTGPGNRFEPFWARMAEVVGVPIDRVPWVTLPFTGNKARIYFNAGIFRYAPASGFLDAYIQTVEKLLDARIVSKEDPNIFLHEQLSFGMAIAKLGLSFAELDDAYNFHVEESYERFNPLSKYPDVKVFHYHRALRGPYRSTFMTRLRETHPELAEMVEAHRAIAPTGLAKYRAVPRRLISEMRRMRTERFRKNCVRV